MDEAPSGTDMGSFTSVPIDAPCPECGKELFGEQDRNDDSIRLFWLPDRVDGSVFVSRNNEGDVQFRIGFECPNDECEQDFRVRELTANTMMAE